MGAGTLERFARVQFYLLLFSLPFEYYFAGRAHAVFSTLKLQVLLLGATWTASQLFERKRLHAAGPRPLLRALSSDRLALAVLLFVAVQVAASALAPAYRVNAWTAGLKTAAGAGLALVAAGLAGPRLQARLQPQRLLSVLALSGTCVALLGFGERAGFGVFTWIVNLFQPSRYFLGNHLRMVSTMEYPNTAGSFLGVTICATVALMMFWGSSPRAWRVACQATIVIQTAALTLTYSRGAMVATIAGVAVAGWFLRRSGRDRNFVGPIVSTLVLLVSGMTYLTLTRRTAEIEKPIVSKRVAHFGLDAGDAAEKVLQPGATYTQTIAVQNESSETWERGVYGLAYRWYSFRTRRRTPLIPAAEFSSDILPSASGKVPVMLRAPDGLGQYMLIWFVSVRDDGIREVRNSFSPGIICSVGGSPAATRYTGAIEEERRELNNALVPGRWELWSAALKMVRRRPLLGVGPDNFRILKWTYMDLPKGDETILANNLYLELLAGSGVLGLFSFLWLAWEFGRRILRGPSARGLGFFGIAYLVAFLSHGLVDYFLKFTPTFLLFWVTLGSVGLSGADPQNLVTESTEKGAKGTEDFLVTGS